MSTTENAFKTYVLNQISELPFLQKAHTVYRMFKKLNRVSIELRDVYLRRQTTAEFQVKQPIAYNMMRGELAPYVENGYISLQGWKVFVETMYDPRFNILIIYILEARSRMQDEPADTEVDVFTSV